MKYENMLKALAIISGCDCLSITEDDKRIVIAVFGSIIKEIGATSTEIKVHYELLKISTWSNGYFCQKAKYLCMLLYPIVKILSKTLDNI